jgi:hypothetical protein
VTDRDSVDRWLAATEWAEIGGDGSDAMRFRPRSADAHPDPATADADLDTDVHEAGPWIPTLGSTRVRIFDAVMVDYPPYLPSTEPESALERERQPETALSCPVHGPVLAGICWRCTERFGGPFTGIAAVNPSTGLLGFHSGPRDQSGPPMDRA